MYRVMNRCVERCMEIHRGAWRYAEVHSRVCGGATNSNQGQVMMYLSSSKTINHAKGV